MLFQQLLFVFHDLCCLIFFALQTRKMYFLFFGISGLQRNTKLNSVNHEKQTTIVKTALIAKTTLFLWRILKLGNLIFYQLR